MKYATKLINLPPAQMRQLKAEARKQGVPVNQLIRAAVSAYLARTAP